jgi:Abortive infection alpha
MTEDIKSGLGSVVGEIVRNVAVPPAKIIGSWLGEILSINYSQWRVKQAANVIEGAGEILTELNLEPTVHKPKILLPLIEQASLEDDEDLTKKWMGLLASSVTGNSIHPSYPRILSEIVQSEAKIIDCLYSSETAIENLKGAESINEVAKRRQITKQFRLKFLKESVALDDEEFSRSIDNLLRVRLCIHPEEYENYEVVVDTSLNNNDLDVDTESITNRYTDTGAIRLTNLGKSFVKACSGPQV